MMGYSMSKHDLDPDKCDLTSSSSASSSARGKTPLINNNSNTKPLPSSFLDHDIAHLTRLRSAPPPDVFNRRLSPYASTVRTVFGREANLSGKGGRFSHSDRCHVMARYLPVHGPYQVDQMDSSAYVSQFSVDGSLFVAGFQGSRIRIYNVERGWRVQKDVLARSMGWAITDTSLSPDQRLLVYASISPIVHVVNVGTSATESYANVTEIHDGLDLSVDGDGDMEYNFGIFSVKFSTDGRELVAGSNDEAIYIYDLEANKLTLRVSAHKVFWDAVSVNMEIFVEFFYSS
ncbi:hypothetical protein QJS04_geneDACA010438 [Acorus gramineus]|uniref:Uncharacterized protein n=1 Tax=Acorus gramineus TaxID=55184 RepID=A0AAV9A2C2_ACOGR|nr:hypothetical protein QJS04_geneDACA010438 [Acorus gramineus]